MRKIFYCLAIVFAILLISSFILQKSDAEPYIDFEYPERIDAIIAMQEKPSPKQQLSDRIFAADVMFK